MKVTANKRMTNNFYKKKSLWILLQWWHFISIIAMNCSLRWLEKRIVLSSTEFTSVKKQACFNIPLFFFFFKENVNNFFIFFFTGFTYLLFSYHSLVIHFYSWTAEYSSIVYIDVLETQVSMFIDFYSYFSFFVKTKTKMLSFLSMFFTV